VCHSSNNPKSPSSPNSLCPYNNLCQGITIWRYISGDIIICRYISGDIIICVRDQYLELPCLGIIISPDIYLQIITSPVSGDHHIELPCRV
jgi:hypothetical protein